MELALVGWMMTPKVTNPATDERATAVPIAWKERAALVAVGLVVNKLMEWPFNYILYPGVIYLLGPWWGGLVMTSLSFLFCLLTIWFYDWSKKDWLGIETIKTLKEYGGGHRVGRIASWFFRRSNPVAFLFLSIWYDPFITMVYLRRGSYNGMGARNWGIFLGSLFLGNGYWILATWMGVTLLEYFWVWGRSLF